MTFLMYFIRLMPDILWHKNKENFPIRMLPPTLVFIRVWQEFLMPQWFKANVSVT